MNRRKFVSLSAALIPFLQAHALLTQSGCMPASKKEGAPHLLQELHLLTQSSTNELKNFYCSTIGFSCIAHTQQKLTVQAGKTIIGFEKVSPDVPRPFYHFAFNIPENKIQSAFEWQRKKTPIIHPNTFGPRDEVVHFAHWNAHSIFFLDPAGNLVEYIARHALPNAAEGAFTKTDILYASEIAFIVDAVKASGEELKKRLGIKEYREHAEGFWPIGDEYGLLLMIYKGREWSGRPEQKNVTDIFSTEVMINTGAGQKFDIPGYPYHIIST